MAARWQCDARGAAAAAALPLLDAQGLGETVRGGVTSTLCSEGQARRSACTTWGVTCCGSEGTEVGREGGWVGALAGGNHGEQQQ